MKVLIGHFSHEANTFGERHPSFAEYISRGAFFGDEILTVFDGVSSYLGGVIAAGKEENVEMIPTCGHSAAFPTLSAECVDRMLDTILPVCEQHKDTLDGICFCLHGAGVSEQSDDLESYVLRKLRAIVGPDMPITLSLDLHANVSQEMIDLADGTFGIKKYPHTDKFEAGYLAMKSLVRILRDGVKFETGFVKLPLLICTAKGGTANEPFPTIYAHFEEYKKVHGLTDISFFQGFPHADVACSSASVVVVAEQGRGAQAAAQELAEYVWSFRECFRPAVNTPAQAMDKAEAVSEPGFIVINEASDNPGGGTPGDGTHLLREMLRRDLPGSIFGYIVDGEAVEEIFRHKVGERVSLKLGGKTEKIYGEPLDIRDALICSMGDGKFRHTTPTNLGLPANLGKCARIRVGNVDIIVGTMRNQTFDDRPFFVTGADINEYRYIGLKSAQHFRAYFAPRAAAIFPTDPPGTNTNDLSQFDYRHIRRPIFPLDDNVIFP